MVEGPIFWVYAVSRLTDRSAGSLVGQRFFYLLTLLARCIQFAFFSGHWWE